MKKKAKYVCLDCNKKENKKMPFHVIRKGQIYFNSLCHRCLKEDLRVSENDKEEEMNPFKWIEWSRNQTIQDPKHPSSYKFYGDK